MNLNYYFQKKAIPITESFRLVCSFSILSLFFFAPFTLHALEANQDPAIHYTLVLKNASLKEALREIEKSTPYSFVVSDSRLRKINKTINLSISNDDIVVVLDSILSGTNITYQIKKKQITLIPPVQNRGLTPIADSGGGNSSLHLMHNTPLSLSPFLTPIEITVQGKVTDDAFNPIPGVNVLVKGSASGTVTNANGEYSINVPDENVTLIFSFIGYITQEVAVSGRTSMDVQLVQDVQTLSEVVVVGYGTQKKSDITGAVGQVSGEEILMRPVTNALQGLQGRVAGVNVYLNSGSPTASPRVVIRGMGTINSASSPLYVVDGVALEDIHFLNPNDIESMEVLKDASSTAIYGARGANGVILITTKRGAKSEGLVVGYDGFVSLGTLRKKMDVMNAEEWLSVVERGIANSPKYNPNQNPVFTAN